MGTDLGVDDITFTVDHFSLFTIIDGIYPTISFITPTLPDLAAIDATSVAAGIDVGEQYMRNFVWNWNGTNYSFYDDTLVLMFNFNNISAIGEDVVTVVDASNHDNNGTINGANYTDGRYGKALAFDGVDDYLNVSNELPLSGQPMELLSIEFWFRPDNNYGPGSPYASILYDEIGDNYEIYIQDGKIVFDYNGKTVDSSTSNWNMGEWYHVVATFDGQLRLYINSTEENSTVVSAPFTVKNSFGEDVALFLNSGDIALRGSCIPGSCSDPGDDSFVFQDQASDVVAYINSTGDMCLEDDDCNDNDPQCDNPIDGSFVFKDMEGRIVSYINASGGLCLVGDLIKNWIP